MPPAVTNTSLGGHLRAVCSVRPDGRTIVAQQDFRAPVHIGKGHHDAGFLVLNIANPTAGFFDGDEVDLDVRLLSGAHLCLGTPAAARVYPTRSGGASTVRQKFSVAAGAALEWIPEPFIPHAGASHGQSTRIDLEPGASLLFLEWMAPGRVAMGESFAYLKLRWEFDLFQQSRLIARERYELRPEDTSTRSLRNPFPAAHFISIHAAGDFAARWPEHELDALSGDDVILGHGPLPGEGLMVVRALCRDSIAARAFASRARETLHRAAGRTPPSLGRVLP